MKIFIGGSKEIGALPYRMKKVLYSIVKQSHEVLIGDCYGTDLAVQQYLNKMKYRKVMVYTACKKARNNIGNWKEIRVETDKTRFEAHRQKDSVMVAACDFSIMLWNGKSKGTYANIKELDDKGKKVILIICSPRN